MSLLKTFIALTLFFSSFGFAAVAQVDNDPLPNDPSYRPTISKQPMCFKMVNKVPHAIVGHVKTDYFRAPDGTWARHTSNFRMEVGESLETCTQGPFYEQNTLRITIKSLIPLMSCLYQVTEGGVLTFEEKRLPDGETKRITADCFITYPKDD